MNRKSVEVLLIEDNVFEADLVRRHLAKSHSAEYRLQHAKNIGDAKRLLEQETPFDVILLDLHLPDADGLDGFQRVAGWAPETPVLMLTNFDDEATAAQAVRMGAQDYLIKKEINSALLNRAIRYALERSRAERDIRKLQERYELAVSGANDCIWDWEAAENATYFSPRWNDLIGEESNTAPTALEAWTSRVHPQQQPALIEILHGNHAPGEQRFEYEHKLRRADGEYIWVVARGLVISDEKGHAKRIAGSISSIEERKQTEHQLIHDALHDSLTGLPNRALFTDRLRQTLQRFKRDQDRHFATLYFDLDRFKFVNDSLGHSAGDTLLATVARKLLNVIRPGDTVARLGGDEFAVLVNDITDRADATRVADRIHEIFREEFTIAGRGIYTGASVGITFSAPQYQSPEDILRDADLAMYQAKRSNSLRTVIFDDSMRHSSVSRLTLESDLKRALDKQELVLYYQPIISLEDERITAFEALLRWQHPEQGLLKPEHFLAVAEETGQLETISWWVIEQACGQAKKWQQLFNNAKDIGVNVNVSAQLFRHQAAASRVLDIVAESGISAKSLRLEMTEHDFMDHEDIAHESFSALRQAGINIQMDDFGTGYSSLSYLQRATYDSMKIDRSFVANIGSDQENNILIETIVALGHMLDMNVVAEGVESAAQLEALRKMQCPEAQGYWFSHPLPAGEATRLLEQPPTFH